MNIQIFSVMYCLFLYTCLEIYTYFIEKAEIQVILKTRGQCKIFTIENKNTITLKYLDYIPDSFLNVNMNECTN